MFRTTISKRISDAERSFDMSLDPDDFYYPDENANVSFIPVDRVVDRLDTLLSHNDMPAARRHLEYWLSEARMGGDKRGELAVLNELMGLYRKMGLKDKAFESAEKADELVKTLSLGGSITAATVCLNAATVCEAFDRPREALERYSEAKSIYEDFLPPGDARLGGLYNNMALPCVSLKEYENTYKQLGITFDSYKGESFYMDKVQGQVEILREKGLLKIDEGA